MSIDVIIKKIHIYIGLQSSIALLIFSISVISLSLEEKVEPTLSQHQFMGDLNRDNLQLAKAIHKQVGLKFEAVPESWMISEKQNGTLLIKFKSPNAKRKTRLNKATGEIKITSLAMTFPQFINHMHQESIGRRRLTDNLWLWAWSIYIEFSILALFTLPVTGLYIWLSGRSAKKVWANLSLISSSVIMIILWNLMRL